jgi:hypothetical protein
MWGRNRRGKSEAKKDETPQPLKEAVRQARIESAERTGVVVDLRDAEAARLELLNEALEPLFSEIPDDVDLFDRGISKGDVPRLWIDAIAHVAMGRDKRLYRFVQDTRFGRKVLGESTEISEIVNAVTRYIAGRLVERERALASDTDLSAKEAERQRAGRRRQGWRMFRAFVFGAVIGIAALFIAAWMVARP